MKEIRLASSDAIAMYAMAAMMEHSCMPNVKITFDKQFNVSSAKNYPHLPPPIQLLSPDHSEGSKEHLRGRTSFHDVHSRPVGHHCQVHCLDSDWVKSRMKEENNTSFVRRRDHLAMTKNFWCSCSRCCDPTEFGSNISTIFDRLSFFLHLHYLDSFFPFSL